MSLLTVNEHNSEEKEVMTLTNEFVFYFHMQS